MMPCEMAMKPIWLDIKVLASGYVRGEKSAQPVPGGENIRTKI